MFKKFILFSAILSAAILPGLSAQGLKSYLPAASLKKAEKLLASIDQAQRGLEAKRAETYAAQLAAEADELEAYAILVASRGSQGAWASPDGKAKASEASAAFSEARSRAKAAAIELTSAPDSPEGVVGSGSDFGAAREAASASLISLLASSKLSQKSLLGVEAYLTSRSKGPDLFPEVAEIRAILRKAGASGAQLALASSSRRGAEAVALSLIASKQRILALAPGAEAPLDALDRELKAYRAWMSATPFAACVGDVALAQAHERSALAAGVVALESLRPGRAAALIELMSSGDARDLAAVMAARRLARVWALSPASRRRELASHCGLLESTLSSFCSNLALPIPEPKRETALDPLSAMKALGTLAASIAAEEANTGAPIGPEPALVFLESPKLASIAKGEERYASLFSESSRRLGSLYAQAEELASVRLESLPSIAKAASQALGSVPSSLAVRGIDLSLPAEESGRRIAFIAIATDASGVTLSFPVRAAEAGEAYASAFAKVADLPGAAKLSAYGQWIACAYDPEGADDGLVFETYPKGGGPSLLDAVALELAFLGGWRP
jgi:hypothetical protein